MSDRIRCKTLPASSWVTLENYAITLLTDSSNFVPPPFPGVVDPCDPLSHHIQHPGLDSDMYAQQPPPARSKRMRTSFKHHQLRTMKSYFAMNHNPDAKDLKQLAHKTGLTKRVLQVSFIYHWTWK